MRARAEYWAAELIELGEQLATAEQVIDATTGRTTIDSGMVQAMRLRCDNLNWRLSKLYPSQYGDVTPLRHADHDGGPLQLPRTLDLSGLSDEQLDQLYSIVSAAVAAAPTNDDGSKTTARRRKAEHLPCAVRRVRYVC